MTAPAADVEVDEVVARHDAEVEWGSPLRRPAAQDWWSDPGEVEDPAPGDDVIGPVPVAAWSPEDTGEVALPDAAGSAFPPVPAGRDLAHGRSSSTTTLLEERRDEGPADGARVDDAPPGSPRRRSPLRNAVEWVVIIGAALLAALVIKTYLLQAFYIPSASMVPTLEIQDRVLVNKLSYRLHEVHRGDVVVFERPPTDMSEIRDLIKRVIGLPGETVEGRDGTVYVDGRPLREPYLPPGTVTGQFGPQQIPEGFVWVMGDNRGNSSDSRVFGVVDESRIVGRAFVRVWPITSFSLL